MKKQGGFVNRLIVIAIICVFLAAFIISAGCKEPEPKIIYVCENGKHVVNDNLCRDAVKKSDAENYAKRYVNSYFLSYGGKAQLISSYLDPDAHAYMATFVVAEKGGEPYETEVAVDGITGKVNCTESCNYI